MPSEDDCNETPQPAGVPEPGEIDEPALGWPSPAPALVAEQVEEIDRRPIVSQAFIEYWLPMPGGKRGSVRLPQPLRLTDFPALERMFAAVLRVEKERAEIRSTPEGEPHGR